MPCVQGMLSQVLGALGSSSALVITYSMLLVIRPRPVWDAQYLIPTYGMLLGNAISCISIGLSTALEELTVGASVAPQDPPSQILDGPLACVQNHAKLIVMKVDEHCLSTGGWWTC